MSSCARACLNAAFGVALLGCVERVFAVDISVGLGYDRVYSSNIRLAPTNEVSGSINVARLLFVATETTADLNLQASGQLAYLDYVGGVFPDQTAFNLASRALYVVSPQRMHWTIEDYFDRVAVDPRLAPTEDNIQNNNIVSTGPNFFLRTGQRSRVEIGARYANAYYEVSENDNNRLSGLFRWEYQYTAGTEVSLNYDTAYVDYQNQSVNRNYLQQSAYLRGRNTDVLSEYVLDLGATLIEREHMEDTVGALTRFEWRRRRTADSAFALAARGEYASQNQDALRRGAIQPDGTADSTADFYYTRGVEGSYTQTFPYGSDRVRLFWEDLDYQVAPSDRASHGGSAELAFDIAPVFTPLVFGGLTETRYDVDGRADEDSYYGLRLRYQARRAVAVRLEVRENRRRSTEPTARYEETRVMLGFVYSRNPAHPFAP